MGISEQAKQRIEAAVKAAEQQTRGEIVVAVVGRCDSYGAPRAAFSLGAALLATIGALALESPAWVVAAVWPAAAALGWGLTMLPPVARAIIPVDDIDVEVLASAKAAFFDHAVHRTVDRAGVLVFLSLFERRVIMLADDGIHAVVGEDGWRLQVSRIVEAMQGGHPEALASVVADVGAVLAQHFPASGDNRDELSNAVRVG